MYSHYREKGGLIRPIGFDWSKTLNQFRDRLVYPADHVILGQLVSDYVEFGFHDPLFL